MSKYNVLWLDDQYDSDELQEIADKAFDKFSLKLTGFKSSEEGVIELNKLQKKQVHYDAILLDARFYKTKEATSGTEDLKGLSEVWSKLDELKGHSILLPRFILSGQTDLAGSSVFKETYGEFYSKHISEDIDRLFSDICKAADEKEETIIRTKYKDVLATCSATFIGAKNEAAVVKILMGYEKGDFANPDYFNQIRKVMEDVFEYCKKKSVFPLSVVNMNERSRTIYSDNTKPIHIRRSVQFVVDICQEGSHKTTIDSMVSKGEAPYLVSSTILNLMNILIWIKTIK
jgi:hypothetical protein